MTWCLGIALTTCGLWAEPGPLGIEADLVDIYDGHYIGQIIPTPRQVTYGDSFVTLADREGRSPAAVIVDADAPFPVKLAAAELSARAGYLAGAPASQRRFLLPVLTAGSPEARRAAAGTHILLGINEDAERARERAVLDNDTRPEGYRISLLPSGDGHQIAALGSDALGAYYAAQSLQQLLTLRDGAVVLRRATITDWPAFRIRAHQYDGGFPAPDTARHSLKWAAKFKLNQLGFGQAYDSPMQWRSLSDEHRASTEYLCGRAAAQGVVRAAFYPHPHRSKPEFNIRISDPSDMDALVDLCAAALQAGAGAIMLRSDDIWPLAPEDQERFGDQANAHLFMVNELNRRLRERWPQVVLMFCPPHYTNGTIRGRQGAEDYTRRLGAGLDPEVLIVWTGPVTRSLVIEPADVDYFVGLVARAPLLWDNTVYAHRSRYGYDPRHPGYFLDTFATRYPADFPERSHGVSFNWAMGSPLALVGGINTADCLWNPAAYDPEASLRRALAIVAGPDCVDDLLELRDAYYGVLDAVTSGAGFQYARQALTADAKLDGLLLRLEAKCDNQSFLATLTAAVGRVRARGTALRSAGERRDRAAATALLDLDLSSDEWREETRGAWEVHREGEGVSFTFPVATRAEAGAHATVSRRVAVPDSPTGRYYLVFSASDDYTSSGTPGQAWPGYQFKQALLDDVIVWEDDVEGTEPVDVEAAQVVDVTALVAGKKEITVAFRGLDRRGVSNMGVRIVFASPVLAAGPFSVESQRGEVPNWDALNPSDRLTVLVAFDLAAVGARQALFNKATPHQYFAFIHEDGHVQAGVFCGGLERGLGSAARLDPGPHSVALVYDGAELALYVDGARNATQPLAEPVTTALGNLHLGQYAGGSIPLQGRILRAGVWGRALSDAELRAALAGDPPSDGLAGYWVLDDQVWLAPNAAPDGQPCTVYRILSPPE